MKKILITGITGFAGSHVADTILKEEPTAALYGLRRVNSRMRNVKHIQNNVQWVTGDLTDPYSMIETIKKILPDEIYHFGALSWVTPSWNMPAAYINVNAIGTVHLLEAIRFNKITPRVLVSCTPEEYGDVKQEELPITEHSELSPVNLYAASKMAQDAVCQSYHASYGLAIVRTRAFNHEGPRRDISGALASFAYQIAAIERGLQKPVISVGNLEATRNFTHVKDMARAYWLAMRHCVPGELYLIGSKYVFTMKECLEKLISLSSLPQITYTVEPSRVRPTELRHLVGDYAKFKKATHWEPQYSFDEILCDILKYWREFIDLGLY